MNANSSEDYIRDTDRIIELLLKLRKQAVPLKLDIEGLKGMSAIIEVQSDSHSLLLDELPGDVPPNMVTHKNVTVHGEIEGVAFSFDTRLESTPMHAAIPALMYYHQRRQDYRVHVGLGDKITLSFRDFSNMTVEGVVRDLSAGGLGFEFWFNHGSPVEWRRGDQIDNCLLKLGRNESLRCNVRVCYIKTSEQQPHQRIGAEFVDLTPADKRRIRLYSMSLEREQRRRATATER